MKEPRLTIPGWSSYKFHGRSNVGSRYGPPPPPKDPLFKWLVLAFLLVLGLLISLSLLASACHARQTQPDPKRVHEIQSALISHDYPKGKNWHETQEILRDIARTYHWQTHYAPDARVLILLGLSNKDPEVIDEEPNQLDKW
jgi:hypothetical protein